MFVCILEKSFMSSMASRAVPIKDFRYAAGLLAGIVGGIHLLHPDLGLPRLITHLQVGTFFDPRPIVFTLTALLIAVGLLLFRSGFYPRVIYAAGIVLMVTFIGGYVAWHTFLNHGAFWPHIPATPHNDLGYLESVYLHLIGDPVALVSKFHELALLGVLVVLFKVDTDPQKQ